MTTTSRRRLSVEQIHRQIALTTRALRLKQAKAVRLGLVTQDDIDRMSSEVEQAPRAERLGVGSTIEWGGALYRIDSFNADEVIVTRVNRPATETWVA